MDDGLATIESKLGHCFQNKVLLQQALTHKSFGDPHNERLEFVGDAVLGLVIASQLFEIFPDANEGKLSQCRAKLVNMTTLAQIASQMNITAFMRMSQGEFLSGGTQRNSIKANALEAIFGALLLDAGYTVTQKIISTIFQPQLTVLDKTRFAEKDAKTQLQEYMQARHKPLPVYSLISTSGKAHEPLLTVACGINGISSSFQGKAKNRRSAEQKAAALALAYLNAHHG